MNLDDYKSKISLQLGAEPQRQAKAMAAVEALRSGVAELASLGYRLAVVEEQGEYVPPAPDEFPKMLYRKGEYPTEITVSDELAEGEAREKGYAGLNEGPKASPVAQPAVNSEPKATMTAPDGYVAPKPAVTDKDALQRNIDAGVGASKPNIPAAEAAAKSTP